MPSADSLTVTVDAAQAVKDLCDLSTGTSSAVAYELQSAIEGTTRLLEECQRPIVRARLSAHLDVLFAEQLRQVTLQPLPVIE